jgi:hypothetical protein
MKSIRKCSIVALAIMLSSCAARADTSYASESDWLAALSGSPTMIDFEGLGPLVVGSGPGTNTFIGGLTFAIGPAGAGNQMTLDTAGTHFPQASITVQPPSGTPADLLVTLDFGAATALGFDFSSLSADVATITLSDGTVFSDSLPASTLEFFGVTAPGGVDSVDITLAPGTSGVVMTDFSSGVAGQESTSVTPEPSSFLLLGSGLLGIAGLLKRRLLAA